MDASNMVAHELESYRVPTFSAKEMAFDILGLMHPLLCWNMMHHVVILHDDCIIIESVTDFVYLAHV